MEIKITFSYVFLLCLDVKNYSQNYFKPFCKSTAGHSFPSIISLCVTLCSMTFCFTIVFIFLAQTKFFFYHKWNGEWLLVPSLPQEMKILSVLKKKTETRCWTFPTMCYFRWNLNFAWTILSMIDQVFGNWNYLPSCFLFHLDVKTWFTVHTVHDFLWRTKLISSFFKRGISKELLCLDKTIYF